jgi:hypothetical protein
MKVSSKFSLNGIYGGLHWATRLKQSRQIHRMIGFTLLSKKIPIKLFKSPVNIVFGWNSKLDLDNHGYLAKLIIDGLKGYLIKNDTRNYIRTILHTWWQGQGIKIRIEKVRETKLESE